MSWLSERFGRLFVYVAKPGRGIGPYVSQTFAIAQARNFLAPVVTLRPGESSIERVSLLYNHATDSYAFPEVGAYRAKMVFLAYFPDAPTQVIASNEVQIQIVAPLGEDAQASVFLRGPEQAKVLQGESTDIEAIAKLRALVERYPDSEYALYAQTALSRLDPKVSGFPQLAADRPLGPRHRALLESDLQVLGSKQADLASRILAAMRLGEQFGHKDAIPALTRVMTDTSEDKELRLRAIVALSQIPDRAVVDLLLTVALEDPDPKLRGRANYQLGNIGVPDSRSWWRERGHTWTPEGRRWGALTAGL